ncbi:hypothetical protein CAOG_08615 [Capsaspora owczarzaki ATCC 30864]|uniref:Uncharacterized protein n=1 Tax=Capsaspora owczarzaki (strain ATCC 30864) TaxID=595528 RepID=A0A0D2VMJ8_CAPO3|nr:hypothetical protein CAOG_08615 [Capsaspora owczarzaki ATCC 30864]KJE91397.1 hypothetical protein CAOG_008615 [Capsaspora owczarzaki ATCC 30864]|eukprot:XP_011270215.1 hypothetical protein CAOG_08615 [Capsaspora owczarzaki ATCC 30864]
MPVVSGELGNRVSAKLGEFLLRGHRMQNAYCLDCNTVLMLDLSTNREHCVHCDDMGLRPKAAPATSTTTPAVVSAASSEPAASEKQALSQAAAETATSTTASANNADPTVNTANAGGVPAKPNKPEEHSAHEAYGNLDEDFQDDDEEEEEDPETDRLLAQMIDAQLPSQGIREFLKLESELKYQKPAGRDKAGHHGASPASASAARNSGSGATRATWRDQYEEIGAEYVKQSLGGAPAEAKPSKPKRPTASAIRGATTASSLPPQPQHHQHPLAQEVDPQFYLKQAISFTSVALATETVKLGSPDRDLETVERLSTVLQSLIESLTALSQLPRRR